MSGWRHVANLSGGRKQSIGGNPVTFFVSPLVVLDGFASVTFGRWNAECALSPIFSLQCFTKPSLRHSLDLTNNHSAAGRSTHKGSRSGIIADHALWRVIKNRIQAALTYPVTRECSFEVQRPPLAAETNQTSTPPFFTRPGWRPCVM